MIPLSKALDVSLLRCRVCRKYEVEMRVGKPSYSHRPIHQHKGSSDWRAVWAIECYPLEEKVICWLFWGFEEFDYENGYEYL